MKFMKTRLSVLLLSTFCLLAGAYGQITPGQDASTSSLAPTQNYGSNGYLYVRSTTQLTYIQFDLSTIPSGYTGANIAKASLKVYLYSVAGGGTFNVDYVTSPWTERTITFNDSPTLGGFIAASGNIAAANAKDYVIIDITPAVQAWLNGTETNNGIALVGNGTFNAGFESKENTVTSHAPELDIVFASGGGGGGINSVTGTNGVAASTSGGAVTLSADHNVVAFQSDLPAAESAAAAAADTYANSTFVPIAGGTMTGTLNVPVLSADSSSNLTITAPFNINVTAGTSSLTLNSAEASLSGPMILLNGPTLIQGPTVLGNASASSLTSGPLTLGPNNASGASNSSPLILQGASFNSSTNVLDQPFFRWQTEPTGNNTSNPGGTLNLLYGDSTTNAAETGLSIAPNGIITFAQGQTFPGGGGGGINSVTGQNGVLASTSGGAVTLSADHSVVAFQTDLASGISTAEAFATNAALNAQNNAVTYANDVFLPLHGGTMLGTLNLSADGLSAANNQLVLAGGKVGIGTATPASTLDVNGTVNAASGFSLGGTAFDNGSPSSNNAFLGFAGNNTNPGTGNTASGWQSLSADTTGGSNVASGYNSLKSNSTGSFNTALGAWAGQTADSSPMTTSNNTFLGGGAEATNGGINNATAIGSNSVVGASNALVLGSIAGLNNAAASTNVGIGTTTPLSTLDVRGNTSITGNLNVTGTVTCASGCSGGGGSGTVTNVGSGLGLTGGPITTSGTLSINPSVVPQLTANNAFTANNTFSGANKFTGSTTAAAITATSLTASGTVSGSTLNATGGLYLNGNTFTPFAYASGSGLGDNAFLGFAGNPQALSPGDVNTAVGFQALNSNNGCCGFGVASNNTATGGSALYSNTTGAFNTASGASALYNNVTGSSNTALGYNAGPDSASTALTNSTAVGAYAVVSQSNSLVLGSIGGGNGCTSPCLSTSVGIGTATPKATLDVEAPSGTTPTVNFGSTSNPATLTVNGSLNVTGTVTCGSGCGGGGGGGVTNVVAGTDLTGGGTGPTVTLNLNTSATDLRYSQLGAANTYSGTQTINSTSGNGVSATSSSSSASGLSGSNTSTSGFANGVAGSTNSPLGSGVVGVNQSTATIGGGYGVYGLVSTPANVGVGGVNNTTAAGSAYGVFGQSLGSTGAGVFGTGIGSGVTGSTSSPTGSGVVATNFATSGNAYGVYAQSSSSASGTGVYGTGGAAGVTGSAASSSGVGVLGVNNAGWAGFFQGSVNITNNLSVINNAQVLGNLSVTGNTTVSGTLAVGGDTPMSHSPRMTFSGTVASFSTSPQPAGFLIPDQPIVITRFTVAIGNGQSNCETPEEISIYENAVVDRTLQIPNAGFVDSGPLNIPVAAGTPLYIYGIQATGVFPCQSGSNITATVEYAMQ